MVVLDSSAILALINLEKGHEKVQATLPQASISSVNLAEVLSKFAERNLSVEESYEDLMQLGLRVVDFDSEQAQKTADLRPATRHLGLSLGDRACLALAKSLKATAVTADRAWAGLKICKISVIR
jgi:PIN domain nuclease of toxin-antitoxin system